MDLETYPSHFSAAQGDPRTREAGRESIHRALLLIEAEHRVDETAAYALLVQASVDAGSSVRTAAVRLVAAAEERES